MLTVLYQDGQGRENPKMVIIKRGQWKKWGRYRGRVLPSQPWYLFSDCKMKSMLARTIKSGDKTWIAARIPGRLRLKEDSPDVERTLEKFHDPINVSWYVYKKQYYSKNTPTICTNGWAHSFSLSVACKWRVSWTETLCIHVHFMFETSVFFTQLSCIPIFFRTFRHWTPVLPFV